MQLNLRNLLKRKVMIEKKNQARDVDHLSINFIVMLIILTFSPIIIISMVKRSNQTIFRSSLRWAMKILKKRLLLYFHTLKKSVMYCKLSEKTSITIVLLDLRRKTQLIMLELIIIQLCIKGKVIIRILKVINNNNNIILFHSKLKIWTMRAFLLGLKIIHWVKKKNERVRFYINLIFLYKIILATQLILILRVTISI